MTIPRALNYEVSGLHYNFFMCFMISQIAHILESFTSSLRIFVAHFRPLFFIYF
jgi:hypothetical protein